MTNQQDRRERIAAQLLAAIIASGRGYTLRVDAEGYTARVDVEHAVSTADALIAELDRTSPQQTPSNQPEKPEGWVICEAGYVPVKDGIITIGAPFKSRDEAELALRDSGLDSNYYVRKWPLDPAEDKEVQS